MSEAFLRQDQSRGTHRNQDSAAVHLLLVQFHTGQPGEKRAIRDRQEGPGSIVSVFHARSDADGTYHVAYVPDEETLELAYCRVSESFDARQAKTSPDEPQPAFAAKS